MSNTIRVKTGKRYEYLPFRWDGDYLKVWYKNQWRVVWRESEKKNNGEYTFIFSNIQ